MENEESSPHSKERMSHHQQQGFVVCKMHEKIIETLGQNRRFANSCGDIAASDVVCMAQRCLLQVGSHCRRCGVCCSGQSKTSRRPSLPLLAQTVRDLLFPPRCLSRRHLHLALSPPENTLSLIYIEFFPPLAFACLLACCLALRVSFSVFIIMLTACCLWLVQAVASIHPHC
jgi:hypothetical protein